MSSILEHFKPPPLASDPPAKTKYWPAPPKGSTGGILQRPKAESVISSNGSQYAGSPMSRVSFAPLPDLATRKRRNSITLGVAARSATLRAQRMGPHPSGPRRNGHGPPGPAPGRPRRRVADQYKDDQVVDLGEVAVDAGKKLWRAISRKPSTTSDSGRLGMHKAHDEMGGPTVGVAGHNTEREISVRGFAVPGDDEDEDDEDDEEQDDDDESEEEEETQHRTEDYVAGVQAMHISVGQECIEPDHVRPTRLSPPPLCRSETDSSAEASAASTPRLSQERDPPAHAGKDSLFP